MDFYLLIIGILIIFSVVKIGEQKKQNVLLLLFLFLYTIASLRNLSVGNDTLRYSNSFMEIGRSGLFHHDFGEREYGYYFINRLIGLFTDSFLIFLLITDAVIYIAYYRFISRYSSNYGLSLLIFLCLGFWGDTVNIIRQELAVSIFLYAYMLNDSDKKVRGAVTGLLAPLFQRTSLVFFIHYLIPKKINKRFYVISGATALVVVMVIERVIEWISHIIPKFNKYLLETSAYEVGRVAPAIIIKILLFFSVWAVAMFVYYKYKDRVASIKNGEKIESQINMVFMSVLVLLIATRFNLLDRCALFFNAFAIVLIPNMISLIEKDEYRHIVQGVFTVIAVAYFLVVNIYRPEWNHIYPYRMFFQTPA